MKSIVLLFTLNSFLLVSSYTLKVQRESFTFNSQSPSTFKKFSAIFDQTPKLSLEAENQILANYYQKFDKDPSRFTEERRQIILENYQKVLEHNEKFQRGETLFKMELNHFSDFTDDELKRMFNYKEMEEDFWPSSNATLPPPLSDRLEGYGEVPSSWNWVDYQGVVQPVQNQGQCGSCYAFAAIAAIEGSIFRYHGKSVKLSEQEAMECAKGSVACKGGWDSNVYNYAKDKGCAYEQSYPYKAHFEQECSAHGDRAPFSKVKQSYALSKDPEQQKKFLYNYGPFFVAMKVPAAFSFYHSGILSDCKGDGGHAVLVVGYGEDNGTPYWIVKNSWGTGWGDRGFFKIKRGTDCASIESWHASFPLTE